MSTEEQPKVSVIEDHGGALEITDIKGTTHVRVKVDGFYLDTEEGNAHMEDLVNRGVKSNALNMLMNIVKALSNSPMATTMPGGYNNNEVSTH